MKKSILTVLFTCLFVFCYSQKGIIIQPTPLNEIVFYENSIGSISKGFKQFNPYYDEDFEDIYSKWPKVLKKPLIVKRTNGDFFPDLHVWYFFDSDSTVRWIKYNWGFANTTVEANDSNILAQSYRLKEYKKKYNEEKKRLRALLGKPNSENKKSQDTYYNNKCIWDTPEKRIVLEMTCDKAIPSLNSNSKVYLFPRSKVEIKVLMKKE